MRSIAFLALSLALLAFAPAQAQPSCLPASIFKGEETARPKLVLGWVGDQPTICAQTENDAAAVVGCWAVDARTGALAATSATWLPGLSRSVMLDAAGCAEGYCMAADKRVGQEQVPVLLAKSTDGAHVAMQKDGALAIFDAQTKGETRRILVHDENAPPATSVGNMPVALLYAGDTIYVVGSDAGPFKAVWAFRQDGARLGRINRGTRPDGEPVDVYGGAVNLIDRDHIALADANARAMLVMSLKDGRRTWLRRPVGTGPCSKQNIMDVSLGDVSQLPKACKRFVRIAYEPYFDISPIRLPTGSILALLGGHAFGSIAVLDGHTLVEKGRVKLRRCP